MKKILLLNLLGSLQKYYQGKLTSTKKLKGGLHLIFEKMLLSLRYFVYLKSNYFLFPTSTYNFPQRTVPLHVSYSELAT